MNAFVIDTFEFCRLGERREGQIAMADLVRLSAECTDRSGVLHWALQGGVGSLGYPQLKLSVSATVQMVCQRCLTPLPLDIRSESVLVLAKTEAEADEIDEQLGDDAVDVIVGDKSLDIRELIEDEALLALPLSARHDVCPDAAVQGAMKEGKLSPFASLKQIKQ